jgi:hypothetical protein
MRVGTEHPDTIEILKTQHGDTNRSGCLKIGDAT